MYHFYSILRHQDPLTNRYTICTASENGTPCSQDERIVFQIGVADDNPDHLRYACLVAILHAEAGDNGVWTMYQQYAYGYEVSYLFLKKNALALFRNCVFFCLFRNISLNWPLHKMSILYWYTLYYKKLYLFNTLNNFLASATSTLSFSNSTFLFFNSMHYIEIRSVGNGLGLRFAIRPFGLGIKYRPFSSCTMRRSRTLKTFWCMT